MIKQQLFLIRTIIKQFQNNKFTPSKKKVLLPLPYFSQFESRELISEILAKKISAADDPLWKQSGASSKKEYALWSWNACGMACLKMILAYKIKKKIPIVTLGKRCKKFGGYSGKKLDGLFYAPFLQFIKKDFQLDGRIISPMVLADVISALENGQIVIASVSPSIDTPNASSSHAGGHLVPVIGYDWSRKTISYHDPSGMTREKQENVTISFQHFQNFFAYKGIII
jgi:hypothetical protein